MSVSAPPSRFRRLMDALMRPSVRSFLAPISAGEAVVVGAITVLIATWAYRIGVDRPGAISPLGYFGWADQRDYLRITMRLVSGQLPVGPVEYDYGLGYPVLGVPLAALGRADPYFVPDMLMAAIAMIATYALAVRMLGRRGAVMVVALILFGTQFVALSIVPWSSMVTVVSLAVALAMATAPTTLNLRRAAVLGVLTGWVFSARYVDALVVGAIAVWCVVTAPPTRRLASAVWVAIPAAAFGAVVLITQWIELGSPFTTPYASHVRSDGTNDQSVAHFHLSSLVVHFWETFVSGQSAGVPTGWQPLLVISPFLVIFPIGAVVILRRRRLRSLHVVALCATLFMSALYLSFVAGGGQDLQYRNFRYWIAFYPYWTILAVAAAQAASIWAASRISGSQQLSEPTGEPERVSAE